MSYLDVTHGHAQRLRRDRRDRRARFDGRHPAVDAAAEPVGRAVAHRAGQARVEAGRGARRALPAQGSARADARASIPNIVIDCPPTLGLLTVNALVAATHLLIPIQSSYFALEGTDDLLETIEKVRARANPDLRILGVVITMHDKRTALARDIRAQIDKVFGSKVFKTVITKSVRLEESPAYKESIFTFAPESTRRGRVLPAVRGGHGSCLNEDCRETVRMRHDEHYVEALTSSAGAPIGRMVPIDQLDPNPNQPRQVMGDLSELMASIAEKGIIEPIIVRQRGGRFQIVAGERRYQAAVQVGLREIPIVIREVDDNEIIEIALIENIQRKDLTPFEEAEALQSLAERCGYTHEDMARRLGKSRTVDYRVAVAEQHARRGQKPLSAGRHSLQVIAFSR